tara:strand:+ start:264 stop:479 length:216 start_codon:yes stop_codon:yes gene_type:complete
MKITEQNLTVGEGGSVTFKVPRPVGTRIRVVVLEHSKNLKEETLTITKFQADTGFARNVLGNPSEDVWNEI